MLKGKVALVTGSTSGIGLAIARALAKEGADVVINYLPEEEEDAREVIALIEKEGVVAKGIPGDMKDEAFCRSLVKQASEAMGGLDILVNVAGKQTHQKTIEDITTALGTEMMLLLRRIALVEKANTC